MRLKQISVAAILAICSSTICTLPASADSKIPTPTNSANSDSFKAAMEKFREDQKTFQIALKDYEEKRRAINKSFKEAVDKALADSRALIAPGQTQLQKRQGVVARQNAVMAATAIRDAAIEALGFPPIPPTPPARAPKAEKNKKSTPQSGPSPTSN